MSKTVLITGCSEGTIGNGLALEFARRGWTVYATARRTTTMGNLSAQGIQLLAMDINDADAVLAARDRIAKDTDGKLDILFNNAGIHHLAMSVDETPDGGYIDKRDTDMFQTNVTGTMALTRTFAPLVIAAKGRIVIQGSGYSRIQAPGVSAYCASKAAIDMYAKCLRIELKPLGVHVVYLVTGAVRTQMSAHRIEFPKDSRYKQIEGNFVKAMDDFEKGAVDVETYSKGVVGQVTKATPPIDVWEGGAKWMAWTLEKFGLMWIVPGFMAKTYTLDKPLV